MSVRVVFDRLDQLVRRFDFASLGWSQRRPAFAIRCLLSRCREAARQGARYKLHFRFLLPGQDARVFGGVAIAAIACIV